MLKGKRKIDGLLYVSIYLCAVLSVMLLVGIIGYVLVKGIKVVNLSFLTTVTSALRGTVGIAGNIVNTIYMIVITLIVAVPVGIGAAIYLNEYAKRGNLVSLVEYATETLAGIPSIIFGLFGMMFFGQTLGMGYSLLTGACTLMLMILPLITRNTQEALKSVPDVYRNGAIGLGAGKWYMIRTILLPSSMGGIMTGVILSIGRIVGESAAFLFTAGSGKALLHGMEDLFPKLFKSGGTMSVQLYLSATSEGDFDTAFGIAVVLLGAVLIINILMKALSKHYDVNQMK